ncbi:MAG: sterol desaturase family protein [Campylobacterales bacterium]|nr:sterol desaturase family protein [Campylobacterales bacterium]
MEINLFEYFIDPGKRVFWVYILSSLVIATGYLYLLKNERRVNLSKKLWLSRSAILDYQYFFLSYFIKALFIVPIVIGANEIAFMSASFLLENFDYVRVRGFSYTEIMMMYTVSLFIISDFTRYWLHRFLHTIPFLWEFHKVHHSAKVLTPITFYRVHPVENILFGLRYSLTIGGVSGVFIYFFGAMIGVYEILGANGLLFIFSLLGSNLRHSHIKIKYPKVVENFLISPYQHQIHHSTRHFDKNFGGYLSIWDNLFGTIEFSKNVKTIKFGLREKSFEDLTELLLLPFKNLYLKRMR